MDVSDILITLKNLTNARIIKSDLARALCVDPAALRRKELAKVQLKPCEIKKIEDYFCVSLNRIIENTLERRFDNEVIKNQKDYGKRIKKIQEKNNLSKRQMSGILDLSETEFGEMIDGKVLPNLIILNNLKQNFKVSIDWLLYGE